MIYVVDVKGSTFGTPRVTTTWGNYCVAPKSVGSQTMNGDSWNKDCMGLYKDITEGVQGLYRRGRGPPGKKLFLGEKHGSSPGKSWIISWSKDYIGYIGLYRIV